MIHLINTLFFQGIQSKIFLPDHTDTSRGHITLVEQAQLALIYNITIYQTDNSHTCCVQFLCYFHTLYKDSGNITSTCLFH
jgi:hypothetical protein